MSTFWAAEENCSPLIHTPQLSLRPRHLRRSTFWTVLPYPRILRLPRRDNLNIRREFCSKNGRKLVDDYCC